MFQPTDEQQSLGSPQVWFSEAKRERLKQSWAETFRKQIVPLIDENKFAPLYHDSKGAPCTSVRMQVGLLIFKEMFELTDQQVLRQFEWNIQWHYAIGIKSEDAHVTRKTLYNFRQRLMESDAPKACFEDIVQGLIECGDLETGRQRQDSTRVLSNIQKRSRLGLFVETIEAFLRELQRECPDRFEALPERWHKRYGESDGQFGDVESSSVRRRLEECAEDLAAIVQRFQGESDVEQLTHWEHLGRLLDEQCRLVDKQGEVLEVVSEHETSSGGFEASSAPEATSSERASGEDGESRPNGREDESPDSGVESSTDASHQESAADDASSPSREGPVQFEVELRAAESIPADSLQTPHDPALEYHAKYGTGYLLQVTETTHPDNPFEILTDLALQGGASSDQNALRPTLHRLGSRTLRPELHLVDMGYTSGSNLLEAAREGTEVIGPVKEGSSKDEELIQTRQFQLEARPDSPIPKVTACPEGHEAIGEDWTEPDSGTQIHTRFDRETCEDCERRESCPVMRQEVRRREREGRDTTSPRSHPSLRRTPEQLVVARRRLTQQTEAFQEIYRYRAGCEGTNSEMKRAHGLNDLAVRGHERVELDVWFKGIALNIKRYLQALEAGELERSESGGFKRGSGRPLVGVRGHRSGRRTPSGSQPSITPSRIRSSTWNVSSPRRSYSTCRRPFRL